MYRLILLFSLSSIALAIEDITSQINNDVSSIMQLVVSIITMLCGCILSVYIIIKNTLTKINHHDNPKDDDKLNNDNDDTDNDNN